MVIRYFLFQRKKIKAALEALVAIVTNIGNAAASLADGSNADGPDDDGSDTP